MQILQKSGICVAALTLFISSICSVLITQPSYATPGYDDDYQSTSSVYTGASNYYGLNCDTTDISTTWQKYITDPSTWSNPSDATNSSSWNYQAKASFEAALNSGRWGVSQSVEPGGGGNFKSVIVFWTEDSSLTLNWFGEAAYAASNVSGLHSLAIGCRKVVYGNGGSTPIAWAYSNNSSIRISNDIVLSTNPSATALANYFIYTDIPNYPSGYPTGHEIPTVSDDEDDDGLIKAIELVQGTSDNAKDTDGDGLNDYTESQWYTNRNDVFCKSDMSACAYPDPLKRDLYVEIDWMNDTSHDYKPNAEQLDAVISAFEDQGIVTHFDVGQFGGGNQLPSLSGSLVFASTQGEMDFYDLKNGTSSIDRQFAEDRQDIWHYMVTGKDFIKEYDDTTPVDGTTGAAYAGDDDSIISMERLEADFPISIQNPNPAPRNKAVSGTIMHELGHNLCLSNDYYIGQPSECLYQGIDNGSGLPPINNPDAFYNLVNYESVMNYRYQLADQDDMGKVDYSDGGHGLGDHDDWGAVALGMGNFVGKEDPSEISFRRGGHIQEIED